MTATRAQGQEKGIQFAPSTPRLSHGSAHAQPHAHARNQRKNRHGETHLKTDGAPMAERDGQTFICDRLRPCCGGWHLAGRESLPTLTCRGPRLLIVSPPTPQQPPLLPTCMATVCPLPAIANPSQDSASAKKSDDRGEIIMKHFFSHWLVSKSFGFFRAFSIKQPKQMFFAIGLFPTTCPLESHCVLHLKSTLLSHFRCYDNALALFGRRGSESQKVSRAAVNFVVVCTDQR